MDEYGPDRVTKHVPPEYHSALELMCKYAQVFPVLSYWSQTITTLRQKANTMKPIYLVSPNENSIYVKRFDHPSRPVGVYWYNRAMEKGDFFVILNVSDNERVICCDMDSKTLLVVMNHINKYFREYVTCTPRVDDERHIYAHVTRALEETTERMSTAPVMAGMSVRPLQEKVEINISQLSKRPTSRPDSPVVGLTGEIDQLSINPREQYRTQYLERAQPSRASPDPGRNDMRRRT